LLQHPIKDIVHADPMTNRAYYKPRGYAGDSILLDMIYGYPWFKPDHISAIGGQLYEYMYHSSGPTAVRERKKYLAQMIDQVAENTPKPKVLSVACGHLREAESSDAIKGNTIHEFIAIDQDEKSLRVVDETYGKYGINTIKTSILDILRGKFKADGFDLIYASGIYDYLNKKIASKLTCRLFKLLANGGKLLITNFVPGIKEWGYMESYMAWQLIYRDEKDMVEITQDIPREQMDRLEICTEEQNNIIFLCIYKQK
jgi:extracellular factor (EF) 3-hydroxypalmitic acid methyl ester biosynthesis protein